MEEIKITKEMKEEQKELLKEYAEMLEKYVWKTSQEMVDFSVKEVAWISKLKNGMCVVIDKERLETSFCFGYSDSAYDTDDYDRANEMARHARTSEDYFVSENMKHIESMIHMIGDAKTKWFERPFLRVSYAGQEPDSKFRSISLYRSKYTAEQNGEIVQSPAYEGYYEDYVLTNEDLDELVKAYGIVAQMHLKRVQTYLKRYGLKHVHSWSYWRDA